MVLLLLLLACGSPPADAPRTAAEPPRATTVASEGLEADLARASGFYASRPLYERPLAVGLQVPSGVASLQAEHCGSCHPAIYQEWKSTTHAHAWTDRQLQEEMKKSSNRWLCENCHTPLLVQQATWTVGLTEGDVEAPLLVTNASFDPELQQEGITCAACHVREGAIHGPGLPDSRAPHPVVADESFRSEAVCLRCHQAQAEYPGKSFVCTFNTGGEWSSGPYAGESSCVDCHMPSVERPAAVGGPTRTVRQHYWRGAGIPKVAGVHPPREANEPGLAIHTAWTPPHLELTLTNERAGHMLPTGDPERWVQVDVSFHSEDGVPVGEPSQYRIGQQWTWHPVPEKVADNRLAPRASRTERLPIPAGAVEARIEASSHRMTDETAAYHGLEDYPRSVVTHRMTVNPLGVHAEASAAE
jgi:hypothetical protein